MDSLNNNLYKCADTVDIEDLLPKEKRVSWIEAIQVLDPLIHDEVAYLDKIGRKFASKHLAKSWETMLRGH